MKKLLISIYLLFSLILSFSQNIKNEIQIDVDSIQDESFYVQGIDIRIDSVISANKSINGILVRDMTKSCKWGELLSLVHEVHNESISLNKYIDSLQYQLIKQSKGNNPKNNAWMMDMLSVKKIFLVEGHGDSLGVKQDEFVLLLNSVEKVFQKSPTSKDTFSRFESLTKNVFDEPNKPKKGYGESNFANALGITTFTYLNERKSRIQIYEFDFLSYVKSNCNE